METLNIGEGLELTKLINNPEGDRFKLNAFLLLSVLDEHKHPASLLSRFFTMWSVHCSKYTVQKCCYHLYSIFYDVDSTTIQSAV